MALALTTQDAGRSPVVSIINGEAIASSRDVAQFFGKRHDHVLQAIRTAKCSAEFRARNYAETKVLERVGATERMVTGSRLKSELQDEAELQEELRSALRYRGLKVEEGSVVGGGELDLFVESAILVENKFKGTAGNPETAFQAAGMQGRRYAIALNSQVVIVVGSIRAKPGALPAKVASVTIRRIRVDDRNRLEIRFMLPFGAVSPSLEKAEAEPSRT